MKYLKTYENKNLIKYNIGDYVLTNIKDLPNNIIDELKIPKNENFIFAKILNTHLSKDQNVVTYLCLFPYGKNTHFSMYDYEVIRKLTTEEIEEYKIISSLNKYNL